MYLRQNVNERLGQSVQDDYKNTIEKIKNMEIFKNDVHFWKEYNKLDHKELNIMDVKKLAEYTEHKTWYQILGTDLQYLSYSDLQLYIHGKYPEYSHINKQIYKNIRSKNNRLPKYPLELYKFNNINYYENLINK